MYSELVFRIILSGALVAMLSVRFYYLAVMRAAFQADFESSYENGISALLPSAIFNVGLVAAGVYVVSPGWVGWSALGLPLWFRWAGVGLVVGGLWLFCWTHLALGANFSWDMRLRRDHQLVTGGPYRWMRHPMYSALVVSDIGYFLISANWFIGVMMLASTLAVIAYRLNREERMLLEKFGEEYRAYMQHTGRLLPRL